MRGEPALVGPSRRELLARAFAMSNETLGPERSTRVMAKRQADAEHQLAGLFNDLSRTPERLHALLDDVDGGADVIARVRSLRRTVGSDHRDVYMVVRAPVPLSREVAERTIRQHYRAMRALVKNLDDAPEIPTSVPIRWGAPPERAEWNESLEPTLRDAQGEVLYAAGADHPLLALKEAAYSIAASYEIARWVLWPAYAPRVTARDPFRAYVRLWRHGVRCWHFETEIRAWDEAHRPASGPIRASAARATR